MARYSPFLPKGAYGGSTFAHGFPPCIVQSDPAALYLK
jgi:hypothetical protein